MARTRHTAWTPQSRPDSIMLLGGYFNAAKLTAEIVPGDVIRGKLSQAYNISSQVETRLNWNMMEGLHVGFQKRTRSS